jgi:hypothetical protein
VSDVPLHHHDFVHVVPFAGLVYVPMPPPPARYLSRKSPGNELLELKFASTIVPWNVTLVRLVQPLKAKFPMLVTLLGMVMLVRLVQLLKTLDLMLVTLLGMVTSVRLAQP